ncbi:MAG: dienelactone hydrolase family protein [Actinomycetota bacterium]|nr:dienelactone hydrolase family protein [Actinomycetota bacterium]
MAAKSSPTVQSPTLEYLSHLGPHRIASGDLAAAGIPGVVYAPTSGRDLPVVALGHGWLQPVRRYTETLKYLASWGFIAIAPATERGPVPSHSGLGADLSRALRAVVTGSLAGGVVTGNRSRLGVLGHSVGGGAAVLAAAGDPAIKAVVTVTAAATKQALRAAGNVTVPGLHLVGASDAMSDNAGAELARSWAGPVQLREVKGAQHLGLAEGRHWTTAITGNGAEKRIQQATRTLATAFLLRHIAGQDQLADELDSKVSGTSVIDLDDPKWSSA